MEDRRSTDADYKVDITVSTHIDGICERDAIWNEVLTINPNITINQVRDGIKYGWYYLDIKSKVRISINEYNRHLWSDNA